ncbi:MAG: hypothetical protein ACREBR_05155 [bacterium]
MSMYSRETYALMLDQMLSYELSGISSFASERNIIDAMKRVLGNLIKKETLKRYYALRLDDSLNVYVNIVDADNSDFAIVLYYGQ